MTLSDLVFLTVGVVVNGFTFACGVATGVSLVQRKQDNDNSDSDESAEEGSANWHLPLDIGSAHRPRLRSVGGAQPQRKADSAKRQDR